MERTILINKIFDYSYRTIPEEKRILEIICTKEFYESILKTTDSDIEWLKSAGLPSPINSINENVVEYVFVNGIKVVFHLDENIKIPILYYSNWYSYMNNKIATGIKTLYDKELEMIVILNKFDYELDK